MYYLVSFGRYRPLKLPLSSEVVEKGGFWTSNLYGRVYPRFSPVSGDQISHFTASKDPFTSYQVCEYYTTDLDIPNNPLISPNHQLRAFVNPIACLEWSNAIGDFNGVGQFEAKF